MQRVFNLAVILSLCVLGYMAAAENGFTNRFFHSVIPQPVSVYTLLAHPAKYHDRRVVVSAYVEGWNAPRLYANEVEAEIANFGAYIRALVLADDEVSYSRLERCENKYVHVVGRLHYDRKLGGISLQDVERVEMAAIHWLEDVDQTCFEAP